MKPKPWSFSSLDSFVSCPRAYHEKYIAKSVVEPKTEQIIWGEYVHKAFEDRQRDGVVLPVDLKHHEDLMAKLEAHPGIPLIEERIALNVKGQPCGFFDKDVWYRGVVDYGKINGPTAYLLDYKTGKVHSKFKQLKLFALHTFAAYPEVSTVKVDFYWTKDKTTTGDTYSRDQIDQLWAPFIGDLKQYMQAFREDVWQPRQSGLCNGWCSVTDCEFWKPKRHR